MASGYETPSDDDSDTMSVCSARDALEDFDHSNIHEHNRLSPHLRRVKITVKDAYDTTGTGMTFEVQYLQKLQNVFDHFKKRSCTTCRSVEEMRFKTDTQGVTAEDTPQSLNLTHGTTTVIKVWSNVPGLQCKSCKRTGYPKIDGVNRFLASMRVYLPTQDPLSKSETITLLVHDQTGFEMSVKMLNTVGFHYLVEQYVERALREREVCRFLFDGERLLEKETPKKLGMINNDRIAVLVEQSGG